MTKSKDLVFYSWKPLSPEASRSSPYTHAQHHTQTSRTFCTFAVTELLKLPFNPVDTHDEKAHRDAFQFTMQGFHNATRTLSDAYQEACQEVQTIVRRSLQKSTVIDCTFVWGALVTVRWWVKAVHPAMDCMGESLEEQSCLLQEA